MSLKDYWYIACESRELRGKPLRREVFGETMVLFRDAEGRPAALQDRCAHRNMSLSSGEVGTDGCVTCPYHGWAYSGDGACRRVPALPDGARLPRVRVRSYPCVESDGYVWACPGERPPEAGPRRFAHLGEPGWTRFAMQNLFEGTVDNCLENFLDCPHTVFVHKGWFRTADPRPLSAVIRRGADAVSVEFKDEPIAPSVVSALLFPKGRALKHTDRFIMPAMSRVDYSFGLDRHFIITSQCTPVDERRTRVFTVVNFRFGRMGGLVRLFFEPLCWRIIKQDVDILKAQSEQLERFGGERFVHLETDVIGLHIRTLRQAAAQGAPPAGQEPLEREVVIRF